MSTEELDGLIIRNLKDLDLAAKHLEHETQPLIARAIDKLAESWARAHGWIVKANWNDDDGGLQLAPPDWKLSGVDEESYFAFFDLSNDYGDDEWIIDYFWLTRLCAVGEGKICFWWRYGDALGATKPKWKKFVQPYVEQIRKAGFEYEDAPGLFYTPVRVEAGPLASTIEEDPDNLEGALEPLRATFDRLLQIKPNFDVMLKAAKKHFISE